MARRLKTIEITIKYQIFNDEKEILDKYGYDYIRNAEDAAEEQAKYVAATLEKCEKIQNEQRIKTEKMVTDYKKDQEHDND